MALKYLIVVLPGIGGSVLGRDGKPVWDLTPSKVGRGLCVPGRAGVGGEPRADRADVDRTHHWTDGAGTANRMEVEFGIGFSVKSNVASVSGSVDPSLKVKLGYESHPDDMTQP